MAGVSSAPRKLAALEIRSITTLRLVISAELFLSFKEHVVSALLTPLMGALFSLPRQLASVNLVGGTVLFVVRAIEEGSSHAPGVSAFPCNVYVAWALVLTAVEPFPFIEVPKAGRNSAAWKLTLDVWHVRHTEYVSPYSISKITDSYILKNASLCSKYSFFSHALSGCSIGGSGLSGSGLSGSCLSGSGLSGSGLSGSDLSGSDLSGHYARNVCRAFMRSAE